MQPLAKEAIATLPNCDVELAGIEWRPDMVLVLTLILPDKERSRLKRARFSATYARHLRLNLDFDERTGGYPLTWEITYSYSESPHPKWAVFMDFAHKGEIEFDCSELFFEHVTTAP
jgi:hypothetical protein